MTPTEISERRRNMPINERLRWEEYALVQKQRDECDPTDRGRLDAFGRALDNIQHYLTNDGRPFLEQLKDYGGYDGR